MSRKTTARALALLAVSVGSVAAAAMPAAASRATAGPVRYIAPVDAPIIDAFRTPATRFGAGNRGVDFATEPGQEVRSAAPGEVVFAGQVGGAWHVVVLHADGIRTSYSFLAATRVRRGQRVASGDVVGVAGSALHFGARAGDVYLDPLDLLGGEPLAVHLVPDRPKSEADERSGLMEHLVGLGRGIWRAVEVGAAAADWVAGAAIDAAVLDPEALRIWLHYMVSLSGLPAATHLLVATAEWTAEREHCTARSVARPSPRRGRRIAVLVAGIGSSSGKSGICSLDTRALGYDEKIEFSYAGGDAREHPYSPSDTEGDLGVAGTRLRALLDELGARYPGVPIDVFAHSQGGVVARAALGGTLANHPPVEHLVTLGTPHGGSDTATAVALNPTDAKVIQKVTGLGEPLVPDSRAATQLAETSSFIRGLPPPPPHIQVTSIAARGDLVVPAPRSRVEGGDNRIVGIPGVLSDHGRLPGDPQVAREIALALAGMPATCRTLGEALTDAIAGELIALGEDALGAATGAVTRGG